MAFKEEEFDVYAHHARQIILHHNKRKLKKLPHDDERRNEPIKHGRIPRPIARVNAESGPVAILGAGTGGLYTAMILKSLDIPYRTYEASQRIGGRLYTYTFPKNVNQYQYFDVAAMRYPEINIMTRVTNLFTELEMSEGGGELFPYLFADTAGNELLYFNDIRFRQNSLPVPLGDAFEYKDVGVPDEYFEPSAGYSNIVNDVIAPFVQGLEDDITYGTTTGWDTLMEYDDYSMRAYMTFKYTPSESLGIDWKPPLSDVVNWCETMDKSTAWYDRALSETVLEAMTFGAPKKPTDVPWHGVTGGSINLVQKMAAGVDPVVFGQNIVAVRPNTTGDGMVIGASNGNEFSCSHVISTIPIPCLRTIDLSQCGLTKFQKNALRQLQYGPSIKIGIQFRFAWWTYMTDKSGRPLDIIGGQSFTDHPIRTIVYPSYGIDIANKGDPAVLIASYCWTEDAARLGALIAAWDPAAFDPANPLKSPLAALVLRDLAAVHDIELASISGQVMDMYPFSWENNPNTMGAFAFFGPAEFTDLYTSLTTPAADGRFHFAGEAISTRHAWVAGALNSAWRAVEELLIHSSTWSDKINEFHDKWGSTEDWIVPEATREKGGRVKMEHNLHLQHLYNANPELFTFEEK